MPLLTPYYSLLTTSYLLLTYYLVVNTYCSLQEAAAAHEARWRHQRLRQRQATPAEARRAEYGARRQKGSLCGGGHRDESG